MGFLWPVHKGFPLGWNPAGLVLSAGRQGAYCFLGIPRLSARQAWGQSVCLRGGVPSSVVGSCLGLVLLLLI